MGFIGRAVAPSPISANDVPDLPASKITTGTFADARLSSSSVTQHAQSVDLQPVKSDITALALREATNESSASFNLPNQHIDTFATDTLGTKTNSAVVSGFAGTYYTSTGTSDTGSSAVDWTDSNTYFSSGNSAQKNFGDGNDIGVQNSYDYSHWSMTALLTGNFRNEFTGTSATGTSQTSVGNANRFEFGITNQQGASSDQSTGGSQENTNLTDHSNPTHSNTAPFIFASTGGYGQDIDLKKQNSGTNTRIARITDTWDASTQVSFARSGSTLYFMFDGVPVHTFASSDFNTTSNLYSMWAFGINTPNNFLNCKYSSALTSVKGGVESATNSTGLIIQNTNTVGSAKTKVGGTMLYKDEQGANTLGTDLKVYFSCNGGTNWTEASSYSAITPVYSTGIKQVRLGETTCTSGTDVRYKVEWANQSGSKQAQLHGIGTNY